MVENGFSHTVPSYERGQDLMAPMSNGQIKENVCLEAVTLQDIENMFKAGLAPLYDHVQGIERTLGALVDIDGMFLSPRSNVSDPWSDRRVEEKLVSPGDLDIKENKISCESDDDTEDEATAQKNRSSVAAGGALDNMMFRNEMAKVGVSQKKEMSSVFLNFVLWFSELSRRLEDEPPRTGIIARLVCNSTFDGLCIGVIFANSFFVAYSADWAMTNIGKRPPSAFNTIEKGFTFYFVIELFLRIWVHKRYFFTNKEKSWNWFDTGLVTISLLDFILIEVLSAGGGQNMSFMRILRLMKLSKILRAFRTLKFFKELAIMMDSFRRSFVTLWWSLVMIGFILFVFALVFLQGLADVVAAEHETLDPEMLSLIKKKFGSMGASVLTLYEAVTGGDDWGNSYAVVLCGGEFYGAVFLLFTFFFILALFNILTGSIVEKAVEAAAPDRQDLVMKERMRLIQDTKELSHMCTLMDTDGDGCISWAEFKKMMKNDAFVTYMASVGLEVNDNKLFYQTVAGSTKNKLSIDEFVEGCLTMRGAASAIDVQRVLYETNKLNRQTMQFQVEMRTTENATQELIKRSTPRFTPIGKLGMNSFKLDVPAKLKQNTSNSCSTSAASTKDVLLQMGGEDDNQVTLPKEPRFLRREEDPGFSKFGL